MKLTVLLCISVSLLVGCGTTKFPQASYSPIRQTTFESVEHWPAEGVITTTELGVPMIKKFLVAKLPAIRLAETHRHVTRYRDNLRLAIDIPSGTYELVASDDSGGRFFASKDGVQLSYSKEMREFDQPDTYRGGVHIAANGAMSVYWLWRDPSKTATMSSTPDLKFTPVTSTRAPREAVFQREMVYSGTSQTTISLLYREFDNNMARPAFSQDLKYDISKGKTIGFKGARFEVIDAGNATITYRVLTPLQ